MEDIKEMQLDTTDVNQTPVEVKKTGKAARNVIVKPEKPEDPANYGDTIPSCLRNEKIIVRHIPKESGLISDPKHVLYGGMADDATMYITVPVLASTGTYVNVLTNAEKEFLESIMGLEKNALSIYLKNDNFWTNYMVRLIKGDNILDLSIPDDYIKYKVLLANKDLVAPSISALNDMPKATYKYVIISENEEAREENKNLSATMEAYVKLGEIQEDKDILKFVVETLDGRPLSRDSKLTFIKAQAYKLIQANPKLFLQVCNDPLLKTKVLISKCINYGVISKRGDYLYAASNNTPLCEDGEEPVFSVAARFLNSPKHQDLKFSIEAKLKNVED